MGGAPEPTYGIPAILLSIGVFIIFVLEIRLVGIEIPGRFFCSPKAFACFPFYMKTDFTSMFSVLKGGMPTLCALIIWGGIRSLAHTISAFMI